MKKGLFVLLIIGCLLIGGIGWFLLDKKPQTSENNIKKEQNQVKLVDFTSLNSNFLFTGYIPVNLEVEYLPSLRAINIYDLQGEGKSNLENSKMYITFFRANTFLTLNTVTITQSDPREINGHDAILYEITKKADTPNFSGQPSWRNSTHKSLDIRYSHDNPTYFYPVAYSPNLPEDIFNNFTDSLVFSE